MTGQWIVTVHDCGDGEDTYFGPYTKAQEAERVAADLLTVVYGSHRAPDGVTVAFARLRAPRAVTDYVHSLRRSAS